MMLRVVLTIDCDRCKQSYFQAAVCNDPEPFFWESFASDLQDCAGGHGWIVPEDIGGGMICDDCVEELEGKGMEFDGTISNEEILEVVLNRGV